MTRLNITPQPPQKPASVVLGEMAIAAGIAGHALTLCYCDYPAPLLCEQWKYLAQSVDADAVLHVHGQADVRKIAERIDGLRLIFVHSPSQHNATVWAVQMAGLDGEAPHPRPTILSCGDAVETDEDPGATLLLRCDVEERQMITRWLIAGNRLVPGWANAASALHVGVNSVYLGEAALTNDSERQMMTFRERTVLRGLLAGVLLMRWTPEDDANDGPPNVTAADYNIVRAYLRLAIVGPVDGPCDSLAINMVNRANVFLAVKYGDDNSGRNPFYEPDQSHLRQTADTRAPLPLITRREIADLGNTRSGLVRRFIEYLRHTNGGYGRYVRMGLAVHAPERSVWRSNSAASLAALLRSWSVKQVRTHFDRLQQSGLIAAERPRANGPWLYALPEELAATGNGYRQLPRADDLPNHNENHG